MLRGGLRSASFCQTKSRVNFFLCQPAVDAEEDDEKDDARAIEEQMAIESENIS